MSKKRRSDSSGLDEFDSSFHISFCHAANSLSQLYTQAQQQHKMAFQSGQWFVLEKFSEWIQKQYQIGLNPTTGDIMNYLKNELDSLTQAEMAIVQVQQQTPSASHIQLQGPPPPLGRTGLPSDDGRFALPTGFVSAFPTG